MNTLPPLATALSRCFGAALLIGSLSLAAAPAARSHAIESSLERVSALNDQLLLQSRFGTGEPAGDAVVRLMPPGGAPLELGRTDAQGRLSFRLPSNAGADWELQVDGGPGHRDYLELPASSGPSAQVPLQHQPKLARRLNASPLQAAGLLGLAGMGFGSLGGLALRCRQRGLDARR